MKRTRHTLEQIIRKLKTAEQLIAQGKSVADVCRAPERGRRAVEALHALFRVSERFACRVVGQHRNTQRHGGKGIGIEEAKLPSSGVGSSRSQSNTSAGAGGWLTDWCAGKAGE